MMPLTALIDGAVINVQTLPEADWQALYVTERRLHTVICRGCQYPMHPKKMGDLRFCAHNPGDARPDCDHTGETLAHLGLKDSISAAIRRAGGVAGVEVPCPGGRVDVLATMPTGTTWALEAQLAPLNTGDAIARDHIYRSEYGHTTWVHTKARQWAHSIPSLQVDDDTNTVIRGVYEDLSEDAPLPPHPLPDAIGHVLDGGYLWVYEESRIEGHGFGLYVDRSTGDGTAARSRASRRANTIGRTRNGGPDVCIKTGVDLSALDRAPEYTEQALAPASPPRRGPYAPVCCTWWAENEPGQPCPECNR